MTESPNKQKLSPNPSSLPGSDYLPLRVLADKYGYAKDHIGALARSGRIQAIQYGSRGEWFAREESVASYRSLQKARFETLVPPNVSAKPKSDDLTQLVSQLREIVSSATPSVSVPSVPADPVLSHNGSDNAEPKTFSTSTALGSLVIIGGVFVFTLLSPVQSEWLSARLPSFSLPAMESQQASLLSTLKDGFFSLFGIEEEEPSPLVIFTHSPSPSPSASPLPSTVNVTNNPTTIVNRQVTVTQSLTEEQIETLRRQLSSENQLDLSGIQSALNSLSSSVGILQSITGRTAQAPYAPGTQYPNEVSFSKANFSGPVTILGDLTMSGSFSTSGGGFTVQNGHVGIGTTSPVNALDVIGNATISGSLVVGEGISVGGSGTVGNQFSITGSASIGGRLMLSKSPVVAHTGSWPSFSNGDNASLYINASSPVADGNIIVYANSGATKFVVDAEGDIFGNNLILAGTTTQSDTDITGNLTVEGNSTLGDSSTDVIKLTGTVQPYSLTSDILTIKSSPSWSGDYYQRITDESNNPIFHIASTGNVGIGTTSPTTKLSIVGPDSIKAPLEVINPGESYQIKLTRTVSGIGSGYIGADSGNYFMVMDSESSATGDRVFAVGVSGGASFGSYAGTAAPAGGLLLPGNVGIGTTNPTTKLQVSGSASVSTNFEVTGGYASISNTLYVQNNGNVGIGTTGPTAGLEIRKNGGGAYSIYTINSGAVSNGFAGLARFQTSDATNEGFNFMQYDAGGVNSYSLIGTLSTKPLFLNAGNTVIGDTYTVPGRALTVNSSDTSNEGGLAIRNRVVGTPQQFALAVDNSGLFYLRDDTAGQTRLAIQGNGNVGIGTTNPTTKFDVIGAASISSNFEVRGTTGITASVSNTLFVDATNQRVGIGTTNPSNKLVIEAAADAITISGQRSSDHSELWNISELTGVIRFNGIFGAEFNGSGAGVRMAGSGIQFMNGSQGSQSTMGRFISGTLETWSGGDIKLCGAADSCGTAVNVFLEGGSGNSYINSGNVGIGTTNPTTKFNVSGAASISSNFEVGGTASVSGIAYFSGNVGIGTTNVDVKLEVVGIASISNSTAFPSLTVKGGASGANIQRWIDTTNTTVAVMQNNGGLALGSGATQNYPLNIANMAGTDYLGLAPRAMARFASDTNKGLYLGYDNTENLGLISPSDLTTPNGISFWSHNGTAWGERMRINTNGNIGIGTTNPTTRLDVSGSASISTNFEITGGYASISHTLYVQNNGNVGIGTTNPNAKLAVDGSVRIGNSDSHSLSIGTTAPTTNTIYHIFAGGNAVMSGQNVATGEANFGLNFYYNSGWKYRFSESAARLTFSGATAQGVDFQTAAAGTADNPISWSSKMTILNGGNVGIGKILPLTVLDVHGTASASTAYFGANRQVQFSANQASLSISFETLGYASVGGNATFSGTGSSSFSGSLNISKGVNAQAIVGTRLTTSGQITTTISTGTAPIVVSSTTKVTNLNADQLDGLDSSAFGDATAANQTTILTRIGTSSDGASLDSTLFAGQQYIWDNRASFGSTGPSTWSCTVRSGSAGDTSTASCSGNEKLITGGCTGFTQKHAGTTGAQAWVCETTQAGQNVTAYANCCL